MPRRSSPTGRTGRPPVTSRAEILAAARRIIDRDGWEKLTIRRLAADMGIGATTLYHHVRDREALLLLLIDEYASQLARPELPESPRDRMIVAAVAMRDALAAWPWAAEVLAADGFVGMLGAAAVWPVETIVAGAVDAGCSTDRAVELLRDIWYYTVGEILVRARSARRRADAGLPPRPGGFFGNLDADAAPALTAVGDRWPEIAARDTYPAGVAALIDGRLAAADS